MMLRVDPDTIYHLPLDQLAALIAGLVERVQLMQDDLTQLRQRFEVDDADA